MSVKIRIRTAGHAGLQEVELPEGIEVRDVVVESEGMRVDIRPQDKGWRNGSVQTSLFLNELPEREDTPDVGLTVGVIRRNPEDPDDATWLYRSDADLYATSDKRIVAKNKTHGSKYKEAIISARPWKNPYAQDGQDASTGKNLGIRG